MDFFTIVQWGMVGGDWGVVWVLGWAIGWGKIRSAQFIKDIPL